MTRVRVTLSNDNIKFINKTSNLLSKYIDNLISSERKKHEKRIKRVN